MINGIIELVKKTKISNENLNSVFGEILNIKD